MVRLSQQKIKNFQDKILSWYAQHQRDLPWRKNRDPYTILISEVMSQQTQISRVVPKYEAWIKRFPTLFDLANAPTADVLTYWSGLGYNRRALYLQKAAHELIKRKALSVKGEVLWPETEEELKKLPGIGEYTARAILCFAFDKQIAVIDTNVRKVILTQFIKCNSIFPPHPTLSSRRGKKNNFLSPGEMPALAGVRGKTIIDPHMLILPSQQIAEKYIRDIAEQLLPVGKAYEWNQALMDYAGAMLKHEKIPIPKQSKFKDSDRYYRGQIIKFLIEKQSITELQLHDYFNKEGQKLSQERLRRVIKGLEKDTLVVTDNEYIALP